MKNILLMIGLLSPAQHIDAIFCRLNIGQHIRMVIFLILSITTVFVHDAAAQSPTGQTDESENLHIMTNQDIFFAGEKMWFGLKLLKNHDSYRYSKLIYLEVYAPDHSLIHHEKLLLDPHDLTYGDVILPDNLAEGEYRIYAYTKWMLNFPSYPIATKSVLVKRFNPDIETNEDIQLFYSEKEGPYRELLLFHTSTKPLLVEIENAQGRQEAIFEAIPPFKIFNTKLEFNASKNLIWDRQKKTIAPSVIRIVDNRLEIDNSVKNYSIYTHTNLDIIEKTANHREIDLASKPYEIANSIQVTLMDKLGNIVTHEKFSKTVNSGMTISAPKSVQRGEQVTANIRSTAIKASSGIAWVKSPEPEGIQDIIQVLNDPAWKKVDEESSNRGNYIKSKLEIEKTEKLKNRKEFLPLMEYNPLTTTLKEERPDLFISTPISTIPEFQEYTEKEMKRKVFHEHFEYDAAVSVPVSPYLVDYTYDVQDYEGYKTMEEFMKEVVSQVRVRKNRATDQNEIRLFNPNMARKNFNSIPLLIIDFYQVTDPSVLLNYDISQIDRIEVIYLRNTIDETNLGALSENGVVALFTRKNDYQLKYNIPKSNYILKELNVPRVMGRKMVHAEASSTITLQKPQSWHPGIHMERGRGQFRSSIIDEPGKLKLEAWIFNGIYPTRLQTEVEVK